MKIKKVQGIQYAQFSELWTYNRTIVVVYFSFRQHKNKPCTNFHGLLLLLDNTGTTLALIVMEFSGGVYLGCHCGPTPHCSSTYFLLLGVQRMGV